MPEGKKPMTDEGERTPIYVRGEKPRLRLWQKARYTRIQRIEPRKRKRRRGALPAEGKDNGNQTLLRVSRERTGTTS